MEAGGDEKAVSLLAGLGAEGRGHPASPAGGGEFSRRLSFNKLLPKPL